MDIRTPVRWLLRVLPSQPRKWLYSKIQPWLARRGPYVARCGEVLMEIAFRWHPDYRLFARGTAERQVRDTLLRLLRRGQTFFDVGALWGYYALLASNRVGSEGRSVAFEPDPHNIDRLRRNIELNPELSVLVEVVAVTDKAGEATFYHSALRGQGSILAGPRSGSDGTKAPSITVPTISLDDYLDQHGIDRVDVMKMDIEGAEVQAIEGMAEGLRSGRYGDIVVEWHGAHHGELGGRPRKALEVLVSSGYELFVVGRSRGRARLEPQTPDAVGAERVHLLCRAPHR